MPFDQYHEPPNDLSKKTRTFARMIASLTEEAEAIGWYEQRMSVEPDEAAKAIMAEVPEAVSDTRTSEFVPRREIVRDRVAVAEG